MSATRVAIKLLRQLARKKKVKYKITDAQRKKQVDSMFLKGNKKKSKPLTEAQRVRFLMGHKMNYLTGAAATAGVAKQGRKRRQRQSVN